MARKKIHGVLLLDKPVGISSNSALQQARWLYQAEKAGHGGTLDPFASGLLPVLFGEAAKFGRYYLDGDKTYEATLAFGYETDSGDLTGTPTRHAPVPNLDCVDWAALCARFSGAQQQTPPAYSALKIGGERAYDLARRGETPELAARPITIHALHYLGPDPAVADSARFRVRCSKGTYIRSLLQDLATALDSAGHTAALRRLAVAQHHDMTPLATLRDWQENGDEAAMQRILLPLDTCTAHLPRLNIPAKANPDGLDLFDRLQLENVIAVCRQHKTLAAAGRALYHISREQRATANDSDRLRKYLHKFGLTWADITASS